jgi:hypothetical protein
MKNLQRGVKLAESSSNGLISIGLIHEAIRAELHR